MGGVAQLATSAGFEVTGSDANVYPPMDAQLRAAGITVIEGYSADNIAYSPDLVIVGNAMSRGNVEVEAVLDLGIKYTSGAQWLSDYFLTDRWVVAVAGTHGKTTTASMVAWILEYAGLDPGFLIGGVPGNFGISARAGSAPFFVVEADEYDTAFFDKRSKFVHYRPRTAVLNNLEFDHADIFENIGEIKKQFHHFVRIIPGTGKLIVNGRDANLDDVIGQGCWSDIELFAPSATSNSVESDDVNGELPLWQYTAQSNSVYAPDGARFTIDDILGEHNLANSTAAIAASRHAGVPVTAAVEALCRFDGVKRRLECIGSVNGIAVYDDFAHHPTAIKATLGALRSKLRDGGKLVALIDFRSNSMVSGVHLEKIPESIVDASVSLLYNSQPDKLNLSPLVTHGIDSGSIGAEANAGACDGARDGESAEICVENGAVAVFTETDSLLQRLAVLVSPGDIVVCMSNGSFAGIHGQILTMLSKSVAP